MNALSQYRILRRVSTSPISCSMFRVKFSQLHSTTFGGKRTIRQTILNHIYIHSKPAVYAAQMKLFSSHPNPPRPPNRILGALGTVGASAILLAGKGKYILGALKLTKFASLGSMLLTVGTYSAFYGLPYATGMVGLILVHESGHALVMRHLGIPFSPMVFIPFVGASVAMERNPLDAYEEALVALGGPALGSLGALAVAGVAHMNGSQLLFALADFGFMINLFNLMPLGMMDGGRICGAISPYSGLVGLGMGGSLIWFGHITNPIFYLIMLAGGYQTVMRLWRPDESLPRNYYLLTRKQKGAIAGAYFGLVGGLIGAMAINERYKKSPEQLMYEREKRYYQEYRFRD